MQIMIEKNKTKSFIIGVVVVIGSLISVVWDLSEKDFPGVSAFILILGVYTISKNIKINNL